MLVWTDRPPLPEGGEGGCPAPYTSVLGLGWGPGDLPGKGGPGDQPGKGDLTGARSGLRCGGLLLRRPLPEDVERVHPVEDEEEEHLREVLVPGYRVRNKRQTAEAADVRISKFVLRYFAGETNR